MKCVNMKCYYLNLVIFYLNYDEYEIFFICMG